MPLLKNVPLHYDPGTASSQQSSINRRGEEVADSFHAGLSPSSPVDQSMAELSHSLRTGYVAWVTGRVSINLHLINAKRNTARLMTRPRSCLCSAWCRKACAWCSCVVIHRNDLTITFTLLPRSSRRMNSSYMTPGMRICMIQKPGSTVVTTHRETWHLTAMLKGAIYCCKGRGVKHKASHRNVEAQVCKIEFTQPIVLQGAILTVRNRLLARWA